MIIGIKSKHEKDNLNSADKIKKELSKDLSPPSPSTGFKPYPKLFNKNDNAMNDEKKFINQFKSILKKNDKTEVDESKIINEKEINLNQLNLHEDNSINSDKYINKISKVRAKNKKFETGQNKNSEKSNTTQFNTK